MANRPLDLAWVFSNRSLATLAIAPSLLAGCFELHHGKANTAETIEKTDVVATPAGAFVATMKSDGNVLNVNVDAHCALVEQQTVKITTRYTKQFDDGASVFLTIAGIAGTRASSGRGSRSSPIRRTSTKPTTRIRAFYNPTGKDTVIGIGIALTALGAAADALPIANAFHAVGSDEETSTTTRAGKTIKRDAPCDASVALPTHNVIAKSTNGQSIAIGATDATGHMGASLKQILRATGRVRWRSDSCFARDLRRQPVRRRDRNDRGLASSRERPRRAGRRAMVEFRRRRLPEGALRRDLSPCEAIS